MRTVAAIVAVSASLVIGGAGCAEETGDSVMETATEYAAGICGSFKLTQLAAAVTENPPPPSSAISEARVSRIVAERALITAERDLRDEIRTGEASEPPELGTDKRRESVEAIAAACRLANRDLGAFLERSR